MEGIIDLDGGKMPLGPTEFGTENIKYFEILTADPLQICWIVTMIVARCVGEDIDPDNNESWEQYTNIDISIVRSSKPMPAAVDNHNQVSDNLWEFTVEELTENYGSDETNPYVEEIINAIVRLPIGRVPSHYFLKVVLSN